MINKKGVEISKVFHNIQDTANQLQREYPNDIKFMFRYGMFQLKVISNEYEAQQILKRIQMAYECKIVKKSEGGNSFQS